MTEQDRTQWIQKRLEANGEQPPTDACRREEETRTFVGQGAEFRGRLRVPETFRIDTEFRGEIESGGTVTVGEHGGVEARIRARVVIIHGAVVGDVSASRELVIHAGGRLHGDVETPCLEIARGAVFNGRMKMVRPEVAALTTAKAESESDGEATRTAEPAPALAAPGAVPPAR